MIKRKTAIKIRKAHRYLGIFLGIQFLIWTISGLYFSWTNIDEIHGDQFIKEVSPKGYTNLVSLDTVLPPFEIHSLVLRTIADKPYYWINDKLLFDAQNGSYKALISEEEALKVASTHTLGDMKVKSVTLITETDQHHEYRGNPLPAYAIRYDSKENLVAYVSAKDGLFQKIRHRSWRWFDFLWMTHTMDYEGRDDFNNLILRAFSLLGLITVSSGFLLWYTSSPTIRKLFKKYKK